jgi:hypothetical protein
MPTYADDIDEDLLVFKEHGVGLARTMKTRDDDVEFWDVKYQVKLDAGLKIGTSCPEHIRDRVIGVVKKYWVNFFAAGSSRPIRGYEFVIDTGDAKPFCCRLPNYGPHESKIINKHLMALRTNWWILRFWGPWESMIVLTPKPHQEHIMNIEDFIWRMCVSFRRLNRVTKPFTFPIPRCADAIEDLGVVAFLILWFISLDFRQGFHQIAIRHSDQEKTAFFTPDGDKESFTVMPFGRTNEPATYTAMMFELHLEWIAMFKEMHPEHAELTADSRCVIDDILNWCTDPYALVDLFECICIVFLSTAYPSV